MDTKGLRHHKRPKKIKSNSKRGNTDVLVVPPDILKKLGISIGNANAAQHNPNNVEQIARPVKPDSTSNPMSNFGKIPSESSILETANLMKKSVFLSPTFVPTVANAISGEVEISNNKTIVDCAVGRNVPLDNREFKNIFFETTTINDPVQENKNNVNGEFTNNGHNLTAISDVSRDSTQEYEIPIEQAKKNISVGNINKTQVVSNDCIQELSAKYDISTEIPITSDLMVNGGNHSDPRIGVELSSNTLEECTFVIKHAEGKMNMNSLGVSEIQMKQPESDLISVEGIVIPLQNVVGDNNPVSMEDNIIQIEQAEKNIISVGGSAIQIEQSEHNFISLEESGYAYEQSMNNLISLKGCATQTGQTQNDISLVGKTIHIEQTGNNIICLEGRKIEIVQADNNVMALGVIEPVGTVYNEDLITKDEKHGLRDIEFVSNLTDIGICNSLSKANEDIPHCSDQKHVVQIEGAVLKHTESNNILDHSNEADIMNQLSVCAEIKSDIVNKKVHKVNIISEEIIPISNHKELSRSQSPVVRALTPVPLNTIIGPKKNIDINSSSVSCQSILPVYNNADSESSVEKTGSTVEFKTQKEVDSACDQNYLLRTSIINDNCDVTENKSEEFCEKKLHNHAMIVKGNLKNNNDIFVSTVNTATIVNNSGNMKDKKSNKDIIQLSDSFVIENDSKLNLTGSEKDDKNGGNECIEKKDKNVVLHSDKATQQDSDASSENYFDKNSSSGEETNHKNDKLKSNHESSCNKKQVNDPKKTVDRKKKKKKNTADRNTTEVNVNEDKVFCDDQLTSILTSSKENNNSNTHLDKVKEIAEYIKKFAHIYKDKNKVVNKDTNKATDNKKETIISKSNMIQSKLCIQGVEKPGGKGKEGVNEIKPLKTYTRQKKLHEPCSVMNISDRKQTIACEIVGASDTELNSINITNSYKKQAFCLCYDFGRLGTRDYDKCYEHIHFWLHDSTSDLDTIFSIYNDDEIGLSDRTELDEEKITEQAEDETETSNICWNYFLKDEKETDEKITHQIQEMDYCVISESDINSDNSVKIPNQASIGDANVREYNVKAMIEDYAISTDDDSQLMGDGNTGYEINSIFKIKDSTSNPQPQTTKLYTTTAAGTTGNIEENVNDNNSKTANNKQGAPDSNTIKTADDKGAANSTKFQQNSRKRSLSGRQSLEASNVSSGPTGKKNVKCGVCNHLLSEAEWEHHVANKHYHVAWKADQLDQFLLDDPILLEKLHRRLQCVGSLKCPICKMQTKKFKKYMSHMKICIKQDPGYRRESTSKDLVTCAVCKRNVQYLLWNEHIGKEHNYLAWTTDQTALNIEDEAVVSKHLQNIIRVNGSLMCYKCGLNRKRVKLYLAHIETCYGTQIQFSTMGVDLNSTRNSEDNESAPDRKVTTCGVCKQEVPVLKWVEHIGKEHNYLAWEAGSTPLDLDDEEAVRSHLQQFIRHNEGLICYKCGLNRKRVKMYLSHIETCDGEGVNLDESVIQDVSMDPASSDAKSYECGVCNTKVSVMEWNEHIGREHNYLAWKVGSTPLDVNDEDAVKEHLQDIIRNCEGLICYKCGLNRRRVKVYLSHIQTCDGSENHFDESTSSVNFNSSIGSRETVDITMDDPEKIIKCGVCEQDVTSARWIAHIGKEHQYQAWQQGQEPLDLGNEEMVKSYLLNISRQCNGLICNRCGITKKYPKSFLSHIKYCSGPMSLDDSKFNKNEPEISSFDVTNVKTNTVMCGVCNNEIKRSEWLIHLECAHDYLAWIAGRPPINLNDQSAIQKHLIDVSRMTGGLRCKKCGLIRKYAKSYMHHIESCTTDGSGFSLSVVLNGKDPVECAVCSEKVDPCDWRDHAMKNHYNVAWIVGTSPIEINNPYGVEPYIKEYLQKFHKLVCKTCGVTRVSAVGFYAHIITCGKTEEEQEMYKSVCEICKNKYLRIYKSQHMTMHREQEYAIERKLFIAKEKELKKEETDIVEIVDGRRKAAEKAKTVIQKYTRNIGGEGDGVHCPKCGFSSEIESEMKDHVCVEKKYSSSDSDESSVDLDHSSEEDDDTDIDSNISDEEREARDQEQTKSKKHGESGACKIQRLPYQVKNLNSYMRKSAEDFVSLHLTSKDLFPHWRNFEYEVVSEANINKYMPPLEESCKVRYADTDDWMTYKRFEAKKSNDIMTLFMGACIQGIHWVPPYIGEDKGPIQEYISVLTHLSSDIPKHFWNDKPTPAPALIQIWDCGNLVSGVPEFAMGIALDCGVIWAIDWCPSGARDLLDSDEETSKMHRLGLIAAASANGSAYVFAVPYPSEIKEKSQLFYKLKPLVELRLAMRSNRKVYQATAVNWSTQKGHAHIIVGYSDGTTANFDLTNESPLLKSTENNVTILYPYHDERSQSMCIEDVDVFPTVERRAGAGAVVAGSVGGVGAGLGRGAGTASGALHSHAAAARVLFPPHWPGALLAGDDNLVSQAINELEWYGAGRRVGGMRACCGCAWCGRVAASAAPALRLLRAHPAYSDLHRQVIAFVQMVPFGSKRKRKNDELSMIMEPLTYDDAIAKYGLEFKHITAKDKNTQQKLSGIPRETFPERFPLSDVAAMAFCPSAKNHHKLAVATHAGLMFIINV